MIMNLLEEYVGETSEVVGVSGDFLDKTPKAYLPKARLKPK